MDSELTLNNKRRSILMHSMRQHDRASFSVDVEVVIGRTRYQCKTYDLSLGGVRVKLPIRLAKGARVTVNVKDDFQADAMVAWYDDGYLGLSFVEDEKRLRKNIFKLCNKLH